MSSRRITRGDVEEITALFYAYQRTPERVKALRRERADVVARIMPRSGASLVQVNKDKGGMVTNDPTGRAGIDLAEHPLIKRIDRQIEFWEEGRRKVDKFLATLTDREREIFTFYYCYDVDRPWPKLARGELRKIKRAITRKAVEIGLWK